MFKKIILVAIFAVSFFVRLYKIDNPVADWHSWRQADTIAVSRNYLKHGIDLLKPQYDDLSSVASGRENPQGLRFVEFPIYNAVVTLLYKLFPTYTLEVWGRLLTIFLSLFTMYFIYKLTKRYVNDWAGIFAAFFFGFLPYSIYYSRVLLPDPSMVTFSLSSLFFMSLYADKNKLRFYSLSLIFFAIALLIKPTAIFFGLPIAYLLIRTNRTDTSYKTYFLRIIVFSLSFLPFLLWRLYIKNFPEGIPASSWLLNGDNIRFKGAWFRWLYGERIAKLILGYWGLIFFGLGAYLTKRKERLVLEILGLSSFLYLIIFATGNVRHDYYQILIIPTVAILSGIGLDFLLFRARDFNRIWGLPLLGISLFLTFALSWYEVQGYFNINHPEIVEAGRYADKILSRDAKVIAPYGGDTAFLYQTNRQGWPLLYDTNDVSKQIKLGATDYVSVNFDAPTLKIMEECQVLYKNEKFVIVQLKCRK